MALRPALFPVARAATASETQAVETGGPAPEAVFTTAEGRERRLSEFKGHPVLLWLFATWCPSCASGTASVARYFDTLRAGGLQIIQLELYRNLGYPGPSVEQIAKDNAGRIYPSAHWLFGDASKETSFLYDPKGVPDLYFLIDADGILRHVGWTPSATMGDILAFARRRGSPAKRK